MEEEEELDILIVSLLSFIGFIFLILILTNVIKIGGQISAFILLVLLPVVLIIILPMFVITVILGVLKIAQSGIFLFMIFMLLIEIIILTVYTFIKINISPGLSKEKEKSLSKNLRILESGRRLLEYNIFCSIYYTILFVLPSTYLFLTHREYIINLLTHPEKIVITIFSLLFIMIGLPMVAIPIYAYTIATWILVSSFVVLTCLNLIMLMNGLIRIFYSSKKARASCVIDVVFILIPIINLFCRFHICRISKKELQDI